MDFSTKIFFMSITVLMLIGGIYQYKLYKKGYGTQKISLMFSGFYRKPKEASKFQRRSLFVTSIFSITISAALLILYLLILFNVKFRT